MLGPVLGESIKCISVSSLGKTTRWWQHAAVNISGRALKKIEFLWDQTYRFSDLWVNVRKDRAQCQQIFKRAHKSEVWGHVALTLRKKLWKTIIGIRWHNKKKSRGGGLCVELRRNSNFAEGVACGGQGVEHVFVETHPLHPHSVLQATGSKCPLTWPAWWKKKENLSVQHPYKDAAKERKDSEDYQQRKGILQKIIALEEMKIVKNKIFINLK